MICPKCGTEMQSVCNDFTCPKCYYHELMEQDLKTMRPPVGEFELVYDANKHMMIERKKRASNTPA